MTSTSTRAAAMKSILTPSITLEGHEDMIRSISYFQDGEQIISGSKDKTVRRWDLSAGKEIEGARSVCEEDVWAAAVSRDGRWVVTAGGDQNSAAVLKVCEVKTGIVKTLEGHSDQIVCIDISADSTMLASGAKDATARIWNLDTGKLVAGPFESSCPWVGAIRFSQDSKKLAVRLDTGICLEVWDVQKQKLDVKIGKFAGAGVTIVPVFWTNKNKNILTSFTFTVDVACTIYEFDASTLETVGASFEGHTRTIESIALSFDCALLASSSFDDIKLWDFESRQLLASFNTCRVHTLILSPNSRQLAYTTFNRDDYKIYICNTLPDVLAQAGISARKKATLNDLLNSDATRRPPAGRRRQPVSGTYRPERPLPTINPQQPVFVRIRQLLHFSPRTDAVPPVQPRNPLDVPATSPLPSPLSGQATTRFNHFEISSPPASSNGVTQFLRQHFYFLAPRHSLGPPVVEVAPGRKVTRLLAAKLPEYKKVDDTRHPSSQQATVPQENDTADIDSLPDVHWVKAFLCYYSCWSHGRLRMPPRWRLERVDIPRQDGAANSSRGSAHGRS